MTTARSVGWLLLAVAPAVAGLLENGDFAAGAQGWATWSPTPNGCSSRSPAARRS